MTTTVYDDQDTRAARWHNLRPSDAIPCPCPCHDPQLHLPEVTP